MNEKAKFCAECGRPAWLERIDPIKEFDRDGNKLAGLDIAWSGDREKAFVGVGYISTESHRSHGPYEARLSLEPGDLAEAKKTVSERLEPLGLWAESKFGIWSILYYN